MNKILSHAIVAAATAFGTVLGTVVAVRWASRQIEATTADPDACEFCGDPHEPVDYAEVFAAQSPFGPVMKFGMLPTPDSEDILFEDIREEYEHRMEFGGIGNLPSADFIQGQFGVSADRAVELKRRFDREFGASE